MEAMDGLVISSAERDVDRATRRTVVAEKELANLDGVFALPSDPQTEGSDDGVIEAPTSSEIADAEMDVIDQKPELVAHRVESIRLPASTSDSRLELSGAGGAGRRARSGSRA
jgi:hypothetical protein